MLILQNKMFSRRAFGKEAENRAKCYLKKKGYQFIEANYYTKDGEIDLIFKDRDYLVFIEVRAKRDITFGRPEETIKKTKIERCKKAAQKYLYYKQIESLCRFDVLAVTYLDKEWSYHHFINAFE